MELLTIKLNNMKKLLFILLILATSCATVTQEPQAMHYVDGIQVHHMCENCDEVWSVGSNPTSVTNIIRMSKDNNNMNNKLQTLEELLQNHDWFYQYSDDNSVYERGDRESDTINTVINALKDAGFDKEADALYDKYLPEPLKY